jgi:hypothetical protein
MTLQRIMVVQSVNDDITFRREARIQYSPILQDYEFEHFYLIELTEEQQRIHPRLMMNEIRNAGLDKEQLLERIIQRIHAFKPDTLIIHGGFVFNSFLDDILFVLRQIKKQFPELRIGFEKLDQVNPESQHYPEVQAVFDGSSDIKALIEKIF